MVHRSQQIGPFGEAMIALAVDVVFFFLAWIFMPWWLALILAFCGFVAWLCVEHVEWSEIDWYDLFFGWLD